MSGIASSTGGRSPPRPRAVYIVDGSRTPQLKARNKPGPFKAAELGLQVLHIRGSQFVHRGAFLDHFMGLALEEGEEDLAHDRGVGVVDLGEEDIALDGLVGLLRVRFISRRRRKL